MARGDNLTQSDRAKGGRNSSGSRSANSGGSSSGKRGLAAADQKTRERVAREGGKASH